MSMYCFDGGCDVAAISKDIAKIYNKPVLKIEAVLDEVYLKNLSPFGAVNFKDCIVRYSKKAKKWHMAHEVAHVYQCVYKIKFPQYGQCGKPREMDAMLVTTEFCRKNNCPVNTFEYISKKAGCG